MMATRIVTIAALSLVISNGCTQPTSTAEHITPSLTFPSDYAGTWSGMLSIFNGPGEPRHAVGLTLEIGDTPDAQGIPWRLTYEGQPTRDYRLQTIDAAQGVYLIDEQNGITMPAHLLGDTLVSRFTVAGQTLLTRQRFFPDRIEHEILAGSADAATEGAGVEGLRVTALQRAVLVRQNGELEPGE